VTVSPDDVVFRQRLRPLVAFFEEHPLVLLVLRL
jgi:hypothetical protein